MSHLESAMLWAPVEAMTQVCRNSQKLVAKDMTTISASVKALCAIKLEVPKADAGSSAAGAPAAAAPAGLDKSKLLLAKQLTTLIKEVQGLKKKLEEADRAASKQARLCSLRLSYLEQVEKLAQQSKSGPVDFERMADEEEGDPSAGSILPTAAAAAPKSKSRSARNASEMDTDSADAAAAGSLALAASASSSAAAAASSSDSDDSRTFTVTPQMRLDRIFADHLLRNNRPLTAARVMSTHPLLPSLLDPDIFQLSRKIESSLLESQDCSRALAWCGENRSRLNKINSTFEFDLRLQEFLSLVRKKEPIKAIEYARKHLAPAAITTVPAPAANAAAAAPAAGTTMERTVSLPDDPPAAATGALSRNNSLLPASSDDKKESDAAASTMIVADPARLKILQEAMNLLVFFGYEDEETEAATTDAGSASTATAAAATAVHPWHRYRVYWSPSRFSQLVRTFRQTALRIYGLPTRSSLEYVLQLGLGALKTSSCKCNHSRKLRDHGQEEQQQQREEERAMRDAEATDAPSASSSSSSSPSPSFDVAPTPSCPVCTYPLSCLARSLPVAQRSHSRLVCRLSGALMDERNPPMALPNGFVYSKAALTKMAQQNGGVITCPRTKQTFAFSLARMVYVL